MEHIIKESPEETIKRFELGNCDIWVIKQGNSFGVGSTKREASNLKTHYANMTIPSFLYPQGSFSPHNKQEKLWRLPGMEKYILSLLPLKLHYSFLFKVILHDSTKTACVIVSDPFFNNAHPIYLWTEGCETVHEQVRNCVYQIYIMIENKQTYIDGRNKKLVEWDNNWYNKLLEKKVL